MDDQTDSQLLRAYAERGSEAAFAILVGRHLDFVHSAALRMVRDPHLAEDVSQNVFVALANNASRLFDRPVLTGWLHRTAQNIAAQTVRAEVRRRAREQEAAFIMSKPLPQSPDASWEEIAPDLDTALGQLSAADRDALCLRYFERKSAREMAQILGASEEAAQKRASRALERMRILLSKRGVAANSGSLAALISANAVHAAPGGLSPALAAAALAGAAARATTASGILDVMKITKAKLGIAGALAVAGIAIPLATLHLQKATLLSENAALRRQIEQAGNPAVRGPAAELAPLENEQLRELLRLRAEVGALRARLRQTAAPVAIATPPQTENASAETAPRRLTASMNVTVPDGQTLITGGWATDDGRRRFVLLTPSILPAQDGPGQVSIRSILVDMPEELLERTGLGGFTTESDESSLAGLYPHDEAEILKAILMDTHGVIVLSAPGILTIDGRQAIISVGPPESGTVIEILPDIAPGGTAVNLTFNAALSLEPSE